MDYIIHTRFRDNAICGDVNLPYGTPCRLNDGWIALQDGRFLCAATSENAHQHFARNDDGQGRRRGELVKAIQARLNKRDNDHQKRWDIIWADKGTQKYKRADHADHWLWNQAFYDAPIEALERIAALIGAKKVGR